ncbi:hypothetical protein BDN72DRAFT_847265 [Pluteus cervinus]|uniref:Uncharacterized protein n=1 Tax=Pluteus cervinus TaxID=181527 RepID=A0ACD3AEF3_9AGAR|nr:hypothetical protein BDN72DRAFT_847265 [Pluteus cervinus]
MTAKLWGKGSCQIAYPFQVVLPSPEFDSEFDYHKVIQEAQEGRISIQEVDDTIGDVFKHPSLDLASLFERKRTFRSIPSQIEATMLQTCVEECTQDILALHTTISGLIVNIATLCRDLNQAMMRFGQKSGRRVLCQKILSPVKYINHDVLEKIFLDSWKAKDSDWPSPLEPPLQLASVCYRWRDISYSVPQLWSHIRVDSDSQHLCPSLELATRWLERARSSTNISLVLNIPKTISLDLPPLIDFLDALSASSIHIKRLKFDVDDAAERHRDQVMALAWKNRWTALEELQIRHEGPLDLIPMGGIKRLYLVHIPESWLSTPPNYKDLTVLRLVVEIHWDVFEWILVNCTNLERVFVSISPVGAALTWEANSKFQKLSWQSGPPDEKMTLPHLVYLGISNDTRDYPNVPQRFLSHFVFPSLRIFEYYADVELVASLGWLTSLSFLSQLRRVTLQLLFDVPKETLMQFFSSITSAEELSVHIRGYGDSTVSLSKAEVLSNPHLLPGLERLHLGHSEDIRNLHVLYKELVEAWIPLTASDGTPSGQRRRLSHVTFHHWKMDEDEGDEPRSGARNIIKELIEERPLGEPGHGLRFVRHIVSVWLYNVPMLFEMLPLSFDEVRSFGTLDENSHYEWVDRTGPIYHVQ